MVAKQTEKTIYMTDENTQDKNTLKTHMLHARHKKHVTYNRIVNIFTPV